MSESSYFVARLGQTVFVRSVGLANMKNAPMLDSFLREAVGQGASLVCVDLSACSGMDSTFMGLLVGFSQELVRTRGQLVVVNPTTQNLRLLDMLGVSAVLPVIAQVEPAALEFVVIPGNPSVSPAQRMDIVRRAHQHLIGLNAENEAKFSAFLQALEGDLAKRRAHQQG
ncbi:MAG: STAS domain-containing protein [Planctomycetes bacterium]|nr:STAS domain-containing protein [Planctomycetota bacterium]